MIAVFCPMTKYECRITGGSAARPSTAIKENKTDVKKIVVRSIINKLRVKK